MLTESGFADSPLTYHIPLWALIVYWFVMAAVSKMPTPKENERWYGWVFGTLQSFCANLERAKIGMDRVKNGNGAPKPPQGE